MARMGMFGSRTKDADAPATVEDRVEADRNGDGVVSEAEARAARERTGARLAAREKLAADEASAERTTILRDRPTVVDRKADEVNAVDRTTVVDRTTTTDRVAADRAATLAAERAAAERAAAERAAADTATRPTPKIRARTSLFATFALILGLTSVYAALSGRLAPIALVLGVIGLVFSFGGLTATGRPRITGSSMAFLALLLSVGGAVLGVLAMNHTTTWLDSDVDQIARLRDWLDAQLPFMRTW